MKTYIECVPCIINQAIHLSRDLTEDHKKQESFLREVLKNLSEVSYNHSPPHIAAHVYRLIRQTLNNPDPYKKVKTEYNEKAKRLYPSLKKKVKSSRDRFRIATKLAIAGNVIDFGSSRNFELDKTIKQVLKRKLAIDDVTRLKKEIKKASNILYLGDNAGETFFDRILIEEFPRKDIYYAVRGTPVINDATEEDANFAELDKITQIISNGSDAPGTILDECSKEFKNIFEKADLIIAKGQGNYETLNEVKGKNIFFLFMVKCPVIAYDAECCVGDNVVWKLEF
jgi:uncharacterized protein with ATP-grasp and redox domains